MSKAISPPDSAGLGWCPFCKSEVSINAKIRHACRKTPTAQAAVGAVTAADLYARLKPDSPPLAKAAKVRVEPVRVPTTELSWGSAFKIAFAFLLVFGIAGACVYVLNSTPL